MQSPQSTSGNSVVVKLSAMMFLQFFVWGAWFATLGGFLDTNKLGSIIGGAFGSQPIAAIIAPLFLGLIADRFFASERVLGVLHLLGGIILLLVPAKIAAVLALPEAQQAAAAKGIVNLFNLHMLCYMPTIALANSVAFSNITDRNKFPVVRVLGTIGWIAAGWVVALLKGSTEPVIFKLAGWAAIALGVYSFVLPHTPAPAKGKPINISSLLMVDAFKLLGRPPFLVFVICSTLVCIPLSYYYAFTSVYLPQVGFSADRMSFFMSFGQISEIFFMLLIPFFFRKLGTKNMLLVGMLAWVVRYALFAAGAPDSVRWMVLLGVILHGVCYDFFFVTGYMYTDRVALPEVRNQAQSLVVFFTLGIGMFFGFGMAQAKHGKIFADPNAPAVVAPPPSGIIEHITAALGKVVDSFTSVIDATLGKLVAGIANKWTQFWALPAIIAAVVMLVFFLAFWDKEDKKQTDDTSH